MSKTAKTGRKTYAVNGKPPDKHEPANDKTAPTSAKSPTGSLDGRQPVQQKPIVSEERYISDDMAQTNSIAAPGIIVSIAIAGLLVVVTLILI